MKIKIKKLVKDARMPQQATKGSSGYDLYSIKTVEIKSGETSLVPTGISLEIPNGYEGQIRSRSGFAYKYGITVLNAPGTIDSDYRGEIKIILINHSRDTVMLEKGVRIAQLVFQKIESAEFIEDELSQTERGSSGFGESGFR